VTTGKTTVSLEIRGIIPLPPKKLHMLLVNCHFMTYDKDGVDNRLLCTYGLKYCTIACTTSQSLSQENTEPGKMLI
jgi:hypothetical protein